MWCRVNGIAVILDFTYCSFMREAEREVASCASTPSSRTTTCMATTKAHAGTHAFCYQKLSKRDWDQIQEVLHGGWEGEHEKETAVAIAWAKVIKK